MKATQTVIWARLLLHTNTASKKQSLSCLGEPMAPSFVSFLFLGEAS